MSQHDLGILRGEFPAEETSAVCGKQADDVRKLVQERNDLGAKRASYIEIKVQCSSWEVLSPPSLPSFGTMRTPDLS